MIYYTRAVKDLFANKLQRRGGHSFVYFSNLKVDPD
jgi:hypothetical protein